MAKKRLSSVRPSPRAERPPPSYGRPKNRLLAALSADDFRRLQPLLNNIPIRTTQVLHRNGEPIRDVYSLNGGVASITTILSDGTTVEAATVGDEGMLGVEVFLSADAIAPGETLIQVPDTSAMSLRADDFRRAVAEQNAFRDLIGRYTQVVIAQMMQSTACNAFTQSGASGSRYSCWSVVFSVPAEPSGWSCGKPSAPALSVKRRPSFTAAARLTAELDHPAGVLGYNCRRRRRLLFWAPRAAADVNLTP
jgi:hypothetical protein